MITQNVKRGERMQNALSEREQKYYLAAFKTKGTVNLVCQNGIRVYQFADVHCKATDETNALHEQWCNEMTFVYSGEGEIIHNGLRIPIKRGQIHLCFKGDLHQIIPSKTSPLRFYCIGFSIDKDNPVSALFAEASKTIDATHSAVLSDCSELLPAFQTALGALYEKQQDEISQAVALNALNYIISSACNRLLERQSGDTSDITTKDSLLFYIISYLKNNVYKIDALQQLSVDTGYSYSYISHMFSQNMGQSLKGFFAALRMNAATELLRKKNVTEVAEILGYSSIHAFTRAYKQLCGETPATAKQKLNKNKVSQYL